MSDTSNETLNDTSQARLHLSVERLGKDIESIAGFSESPPEVGYSRPTFSAPWRQAYDYIIEQATEIGAEHVVDAAGNLHIRHPLVGWERKVWLSGSHLDSVPSGGRFDGVSGVVIPLEVMRRRPELPLEIVVFAEEEGTTFNLGMLGSRLWAGTLTPDTMTRIRNRHGKSAAEAGATHGLDLARLTAAAAGQANTVAGAAQGPASPASPADAAAGAADWRSRLQPERYYGMVEVHPEQGLGLWDSGTPLAAVNRINGRRQLSITVTGQANHAGSTGMTGRRDALAGAAEMVLAFEQLGQELDRRLPYTVLTVGKLEATPGAVNVIPGKVVFSLDFRAQEEELLLEGERRINEIARTISERRGLEVEIELTEQLKPSPLSEDICSRLRQAAVRQGFELELVPSGALHDAAVLAHVMPTAMIFVASRDGISHNPAEYSRIEDIALAAQLLEDMIADAETNAT
ncbi:MAG: Zn-dependent hydrolase [Spirochaeta sp.]|nr:Zn-dependent hydrolase [Spirochaeta sp.]